MKISYVAACVALAGCAGMRVDTPVTGSATVRSTSGADMGTLTLTQTTTGVRISGSLSGLTPGAHGIHVHAVGRCEAPSFESAGGHANPTNRQHGLLNPAGPHAGDLPAIGANASGVATVDFTTPLTTLSSAGLLDADGSAIVVHAQNDDQRTDPSGASGARVGCGVITAP